VRRGQVIRFPGAAPPPSDSSALVEVYRCDAAEAVVVRSLLESEGIPSVVHSRLAHSVHPFTVGDQGEVVVLVPARDGPRSRRLLLRVASRRSLP
jgi:Putative prokaryotic signal transducing protein